MSWQKLLGAALAGIVVVVLVGVVVARLVDADDITRQVAIYGGVVATLGVVANAGKIAYDIWDKERERKKKAAESAERIKATPTYGYPSGGSHRWSYMVGVHLYNEGNSLINIRRVFLVRRDESGEVQQQLVTNERYTNIGSSTPFLLGESDKTLKLDAKDDAQFNLSTDDPRFQGDSLLQLALDDLWIVVESHAGEVIRVPGKDIQNAIKTAPPPKQ